MGPGPQGVSGIGHGASEYVRDPELRWDTAMRDGDGGLSLISGGIRAVTSADAKQDQLEEGDQGGP